MRCGGRRRGGGRRDRTAAREERRRERLERRERAAARGGGAALGPVPRVVRGRRERVRLARGAAAGGGAPRGGLELDGGVDAREGAGGAPDVCVVVGVVDAGGVGGRVRDAGEERGEGGGGGGGGVVRRGVRVRVRVVGEAVRVVVRVGRVGVEVVVRAGVREAVALGGEGDALLVRGEAVDGGDAVVAGGGVLVGAEGVVAGVAVGVDAAGGGVGAALLAGVVGAAAVDVVGVLCVEALLELLGLVEVELLVGLCGRSAGATTRREGGTDEGHGVPLAREDLADLAGAHHLVRGRDLRAATAGKDHEGVHGPPGGAVGVQRLGAEGRILVVLVGAVGGRVRAVRGGEVAVLGVAGRGVGDVWGTLGGLERGGVEGHGCGRSWWRVIKNERVSRRECEGARSIEAVGHL